MGYFEGSDDEAERRLGEFEAAPLSVTQGVIREYLDMVVSGRYARLLVRQVQKRLEAGRPWPMSFGSAAELLAHLDRIKFQLLCPAPNRTTREQREFWAEYEALTLKSYRERLPRLLIANFSLNLVPDINVGVGPRTWSVVEGILAAQLGDGDLITALKVAMRMVEEGIDGGIRRLRHIVLMAGLRQDVDQAKRILYSLILNAEERREIIDRITQALNASGLVSKRVIDLDVVCFTEQYVGSLVDAVSATSFPSELG